MSDNIYIKLIIFEHYFIFCTWKNKKTNIIVKKDIPRTLYEVFAKDKKNDSLYNVLITANTCITLQRQK